MAEPCGRLLRQNFLSVKLILELMPLAFGMSHSLRLIYNFNFLGSIFALSIAVTEGL